MLRPIRSFTPSIRVSLIVGLVLLAFAVVPHLLLAAPAAPSLHVDNNLDFSGGACLTLTLGDCSLRSAIQIANVNPNVTILFDGDYTITLGSSLVITGSTMTITNSGVRDIWVDANSLGSAFLISGSDVTIDGLRMYGAATDYPNLWITGSAVHVRITKNEIGRAINGSNCGLSQNAYSGIYVDSTNGVLAGGARAWIYGNVIACNRGMPGDGVTLVGTDNVVIGADSTGTAGFAQRNAIVNNNTGVAIQGGANNNKVRNSDICCNNGLGVHISDTDSNSNVVSESNIGHNGSLGVRIDGGAQFNLIGNSLSLAEPRTMGNWIHGNTGDGIYITTFPTAYNRVYGNNIGTGVFDLGPDGNRMNGVVIDNGAAFNYIGYGGEYRNVISGNINDGVQLKGGAHDNTVQGNYIGVNIAGTLPISNLNGIAIFGGAHDNLIGGATSPTQNLISGNLHDGITIAGSTTTTNTITYNSLGYDHVGGRFLPPNGFDNIVLDGQTSGNVIGGGSAPNDIDLAGGVGVAVQGGAHANQILYNFISSNGGDGIRFDGAGTSYNVISRTIIAHNGVTCGGCDGISERNGAGQNVWSEVGIFDNAGLGVDKFANSDATNIVNPPYVYITSIVAGTGVVKGIAGATSGLLSTKVELYRIALDPSGYGEGNVFVGSAYTASDGKWSITDPNYAVNAPCYTATTTDALLGVASSSEFSRSNCGAFLPLIRR